jgi:GAF domain-containing protein
MQLPILRCLSEISQTGARWSSVQSVPVLGVSLTLIWAAVILAFGVLGVVLVLLLLRRQAQPISPWDVPAGPEGTRGQYLQHLNRLLRAIRTINSLIVAERDGRQLLEKACRSLTTTRGYRLAWIGVVEEGSKLVRPLSQAGFEEGYLEQITVTWDDAPTGQGPTGRAIRTGEPYVMRDIATAPEFAPWRQQALERGYRSSAALPLRFKGQILGALNVYSEMPDAFDIEEVGLLQDVADHLAYALGSIRLEAELASARQQIRQAEAIQAAFEHAPMGIVVTDRDGVITSINQRMLELLNGRASPEDLVGRVALPDLDLFSGPGVRSQLDKVLHAARPVQFECHASVGGGRMETLYCRGVPLVEEGKGLTQALWLVEDISTRHQTGADDE